ALEISPYRIHGRTFELTQAGGGYLVFPRLIPGALYAIQASQRRGPSDPWDWSERVTFTAPPAGTIELDPIRIRPMRWESAVGRWSSPPAMFTRNQAPLARRPPGQRNHDSACDPPPRGIGRSPAWSGTRRPADFVNAFFFRSHCS